MSGQDWSIVLLRRGCRYDSLFSGVSVSFRRTLPIWTSLFTAAGTFGHDLWIIPSAFSVRAPGKIKIFLQTGEKFSLSTSALAPERIQRFTVVTEGGTTPVEKLRKEGDSLVGESSPVAGAAVVEIVVKPKLIQLSQKEFDEYLEHEGLVDAVALREKRGPTGKEEVEQYSKYGKALLRGENSHRVHTRALGHLIEIVPLTSPYELRPGDSLPVQVLYRGKPLAGVAVGAGTRDHFSQRRADAAGKAEISVHRPGPWYVKVLQMEPRDHPEYKWESFWATLTFQVEF